MTTIDRFLVRCDAYRGRRGITTSYLSRILFDDGKTLDSLRAGTAGLTVKRLARASIVLGEFERAILCTSIGGMANDAEAA
jgi:hypothetical protein